MELLLLAVFGITLGGVMAASRSLGRRRDPARARLHALAGQLSSLSTAAQSMNAAALVAGMSQPAPEVAGAPFSSGQQGRPRGLQLELLRAGLKLRSGEYWAAAAVATVVCAAAGLLTASPAILAPLLGLAGLFLPRGVVRVMQASRVRKFEEQMADALALIASSLRSGYSFLRAIQVVAQEMPDPIAEEFRRVVAESSLGVPAEQALGGMVERVPSYDLELVVIAVSIQLQVGGNLSQILDTIAETIRERVRNQREIAALTAEGKLSGLVCVLMPFVMTGILMALNPGYLLPLFREPLGLLMVTVAAILMFAGAMWTMKLVRVDV